MRLSDIIATMKGKVFFSKWAGELWIFFGGTGGQNNLYYILEERDFGIVAHAVTDIDEMTFFQLRLF